MRKKLIIAVSIAVFTCAVLEAGTFNAIATSPADKLILAKKPPAPTRRYTPTKSARQKALEKKLKNIIIPSIEFDEVGIRDVFKYLSIKSGEFSKDKKKINIVLILSKDKEKQLAALTLRLTDIPLADAIRYVAMSAGLEVKVEDYAVVVRAQGKKR